MVALEAACVLAVWRMSAGNHAAETFGRSSGSLTGSSAVPVTAQRRLRWAILAFAPTSLMMGVTTYFTSNVANIPLQWVVPLGIYLITFIMAFTRTRTFSLELVLRALPIAAVSLLFLILSRTTEPAWLLILVHLVFLLLAGLACHGQLAKDRPAPERLTEFYSWISLSGVGGGMFNALLAPHLFRTPFEYPLAVVLVCLLRPMTGHYPAKARERLYDFAFVVLLGVLASALALLGLFESPGGVQVALRPGRSLPAVASRLHGERLTSPGCWSS